MRLRTPIQCAWLALLVAAVTLIAFVRQDAAAVAPPARSAGRRAGPAIVESANGQRALLDAGGFAVPLRNYQRIASGSTIADDLLLALAEPERIRVLSSYGRAHSSERQRYGARAEFGGPTNLEQLKRQGVDLLILNHMGAPNELARIRELGIQVFNLGEMRGLATLVPNMRAVGTLLGDPARGERLAHRFTRRMRAVGADIPAQRKKQALYVSAYGGQLFGGGLRSSYHDVLTSAGMIDVAAERFIDFPHYDPEQILLMDPEVVVTQPASRELVCRISGLARLRACADGGRGIVVIEDATLGDPGLGMLEAAEELRDKVYGATGS
jgi:iron complex transport system substrate-binding protein